jgi:tetratricopeptide (TPR) repeat protein
MKKTKIGVVNMSNDIKVLTEKGQQAINEAHYTKAIIFYTQLLAIDTESVTAYANRGFSRYAAGDSEGAIEDYEEALKRSPDLPTVLNNRGLAKTVLGDLEGALKDFNQILESDPEHAVAFNNRGRVWTKFSERDYQRAEEIFSELGLTEPDTVYTREEDVDAELPSFRVKKADSVRLVSSFEVLDRGDFSGGSAAREARSQEARDRSRDASVRDHVQWMGAAGAAGAAGGFARGLMTGGVAGALAGVSGGTAAGLASACVGCHLSRRSGGGARTGGAE